MDSNEGKKSGSVHLSERVRVLPKKSVPVLSQIDMDDDLPAPSRNRKRKVRYEEESSLSDDEKKKAARGGKPESSKGLRHLTRRVCDKVRTKMTTTYREVANELVAEAGEAEGANEEPSVGDQKTVRRRVYDALNVLMAMGIIAKEKKDIRWIGLPHAKEELDALERDKIATESRIAAKRETLKELEAQRKLYRNLTARNLFLEEQERQAGNMGSEAESNFTERIALPFLIIHTKAGSNIDCEMTDDRTQYSFNFSNPFLIHQEIQIIKDMNIPDTAINDETLLNRLSLPSNNSPLKLSSKPMQETPNKSGSESRRTQRNVNQPPSRRQSGGPVPFNLSS